MNEANCREAGLPTAFGFILNTTEASAHETMADMHTQSTTAHSTDEHWIIKITQLHFTDISHPDTDE